VTAEEKEDWAADERRWTRIKQKSGVMWVGHGLAGWGPVTRFFCAKDDTFSSLCLHVEVEVLHESTTFPGFRGLQRRTRP
jgi:hypothetical protein